MNGAGSPDIESLADEDFLVGQVLAHSVDERGYAVEAEIFQTFEVYRDIRLAHRCLDLQSELPHSIRGFDEENSLFFRAFIVF